MLNTRKIKARMKELGLTQADVGDKLGLAPATVSQKINGSRPMTVEEADKLAVILSISDQEYGAYFFAN